jgi:hypothetical protein
LEAKPTKPVQQQFGLFETALRDPVQLSETLARLIGLLGAERVGRPVLEETYRPDAFHLEPFTWQLPDTPLLRQSASCPSLRRFRPGLSGSVLLEANKPIHLQSAALSGMATAQNGPYAGSGQWWDQTSWTRMEWDLQLEGGALLRCHQNPTGWEVDGIYD